MALEAGPHLAQSRAAHYDYCVASPMDDEESVVEEGVIDERKKAQRALGTSGKTRASPPGVREESQRFTGIGLRSASAKVPIAPSERAQQRRQDSRKLLADNRDAHRKAVWAKLDAAKKAADEKARRLRSFEPAGTEPADDDDDFDF